MADEITQEKAKQTTPEQPEVTTQAAEQPEATAAAPSRRRKAKRTVSAAHIHVLATFNNTIVTVTDDKGNTLTTASAGASGFRGSKKGTAYAAQVAAEKAIGDAKSAYGVTKADVFVKGVGLGRDAAVRSLINQKITVESVRDVTGVPHGGVRPRKPKRN
ncbi:MAG TPA: 30S ribosomal protein S11 [Candidatus Saccharimonadales bacterium]|nr:30S ribosomal protein S11 [Candidatus Saccharimonadales bacterium]